MDNREAVEYWEALGCVSPLREQSALFAQLIEQNALLFAEITQLKAQVADLSAKSSKEKLPLAEQSQQSKKTAKALPAKQKTLPAKQIALAKQQNDKDTEKHVAIDAKAMAVVRRLSALEALAGIEQSDIYQVLLAHQQGIGKSKIYQHLGWGSAKHTKIVKPVVDALALQAV